MPFGHEGRKNEWPVVGLLGIEPSLHAPEACVLPVYDSPFNLEFLADEWAHYTIKILNIIYFYFVLSNGIIIA